MVKPTLLIAWLTIGATPQPPEESVATQTARDERRMTVPDTPSTGELHVQRPVARRLLLGVRALGGIWSNAGSLIGPRVALGIGLRYELGASEVALLVGAELMRAAPTVRVDDLVADYTLEALAFPIEARVRHDTGRFGVSGGLAVVPTLLKTTSSAAPGVYTGVEPAVRVSLGGDFEIGSGRILLAFAFGLGALQEGPLTGTFDRASLAIGYEHWLLDLFD